MFTRSRLGENDEQFGYGSEEGGILFYHAAESGCGAETDYYAGGIAPGNLSRSGFGISMGNQPSEDRLKAFLRREAIIFRQPVFLDLYDFPGRGKSVKRAITG